MRPSYVGDYIYRPLELIDLSFREKNNLMYYRVRNNVVNLPLNKVFHQSPSLMVKDLNLGIIAIAMFWIQVLVTKEMTRLISVCRKSSRNSWLSYQKNCGS